MWTLRTGSRASTRSSPGPPDAAGPDVYGAVPMRLLRWITDRWSYQTRDRQLPLSTHCPPRKIARTLGRDFAAQTSRPVGERRLHCACH
jgi:hypothetical protein